jgi:hypothetical protein
VFRAFSAALGIASIREREAAIEAAAAEAGEAQRAAQRELEDCHVEEERLDGNVTDLGVRLDRFADNIAVRAAPAHTPARLLHAPYEFGSTN